MILEKLFFFSMYVYFKRNENCFHVDTKWHKYGGGVGDLNPPEPKKCIFVYLVVS